MRPTCMRHLIIERFEFYLSSLRLTNKFWQKSTCSDYKAVNRVSTTQGHLQATGIGAVACARHGCFFPQSVVDFQKGERSVSNMHRCSVLTSGSRQINIDYAVCQSLSSMAENLRVITIYDVACQWSRNFRRRVEDSKYLDIPPNLQMVPAVGKWHLGTHVVDCFPQFSLNFIQGIGQVDGEVLETLWSVTNKVAGTTRAVGKSHRSEVLDDNMYDSNWKKWIGIGKATFTICGYSDC